MRNESVEAWITPPTHTHTHTHTPHGCSPLEAWVKLELIGEERLVNQFEI